MGYFSAIAHELFGSRIDLPGPIGEEWPELCEVRYRRGGLPLRVGGWCLGQSTVAAVTLGRTVFLARHTELNPVLLLHELRHVQQFSERRAFPFHYIWESVRRGYHANRFESDARAYAARQFERSSLTGSEEDV